jgi:hypothetical protein
MTTPSGAAPAAWDAQQTMQTLEASFRSGPRTTEFYMAVAMWVLPVLTLIFHTDLSSLAVPLATIAAGIANAAYVISRAITKHSHVNAMANVAMSAAPQPSAPALDVSAVASWMSSMAAAVQALTAALPTSGHAAPSPPAPDAVVPKG